MTPNTTPQLCPRFVVCEDGREYLERFERFLGGAFDFIPAQDFRALLEQLERRKPIAAILLDLDFRRTDVARLVNEHGQSIVEESKQARAQYSANQGLCILASLRARGVTLPVLLFADIEDAEQQSHLLRAFGPLDVVPSHVGLRELQGRLTDLTSGIA